MEFSEFKRLFLASMEQNGLQAPTEDAILKLHTFSEYLLEINTSMNLTAIRNIPDVICKHLVDSLMVSPLIPAGAKVLDLGCGPGFPSMPLAICRPDLRITALDSTAKKIGFVSDAAKKCGLDNITPVSGRAEDAVLRKKLGEFDYVVSRAVARMNILCELCLPYLKKDGVLLAMKGAKADEEFAEAKRAIQTLGGNDGELISQKLILPDSLEEARAILKVVKTGTTPKGYPRAYAAILKKPL